MSKHTTEELTEFFEYLDDLRESGVTNMFGASSYLEEEFSMSRENAGKVLLSWMKTFSNETSPEDRAAIAKATGNVAPA